MGRGLKMEVFLLDSAKGILGPLCSHPPTHNRRGLVRSHARPSCCRVWAACGYRIARRSPLYSLSIKKLSASSAALAQVFIPFVQLPENIVRLACVKHIASVRPDQTLLLTMKKYGLYSILSGRVNRAPFLVCNSRTSNFLQVLEFLSFVSVVSAARSDSTEYGTWICSCSRRICWAR